MGNVNSPEMKMIMNMINGKGLNAEQIVRNICSQQGINVDDFMNTIQSMK